MHLLRTTPIGPRIRSLLGIAWLYDISSTLWGTFIHIYIFGLFKDIRFNMTAEIVAYFGTMLGFCVAGYLFARTRADIRIAFYAGFVILAASFVTILAGSSQENILLFMLINHIGHGLYWLSLHTYEIHTTRDNERDFYSSLLSAGGNLIDILAPALATMLLVAGTFAHIGQFTLLFVVAPVFYLAATPFIRSFQEYRAQPIQWADVAHFLADRRNHAVQPFIASEGLQQIIATIVMPLTAFVVFGSAVAVGVFSTTIAILGAISIVYIGFLRSSRNRLLLLRIGSSTMAILSLSLAWVLSFTTLVAFRVGLVFAKPLVDVSKHVINLRTMESIGRSDRDFFATMLLRDLMLWVWRTLGGLVFLIVTMFIPSSGTLPIGLIMLAFSYLAFYFSTAHLLRTLDTPHRL
jgi:hypothetical protein